MWGLIAIYMPARPRTAPRPGMWRAVQLGAHLSVIPATAGIHDRPQGRSVCLSWMQCAFSAFVALTLRPDREGLIYFAAPSKQSTRWANQF